MRRVGTSSRKREGHRGLGAVVAVAATVARAGHDEGVHGAGHADVTEAALLLHLRGVLQGTRVGEEAFFHAGARKTSGKLQALGGVQGHERHGGLRRSSCRRRRPGRRGS